MPAIIAAILGIGLDAGGAYLGATGAQDTIDQMNQTTRDQLARLRGFGQQGRTIENNALQQSTPAAAARDISQGQSQFTNAANLANQYTPGFATPLSSTNKSVSDARAGLGATAMGNFAGYSNLGQQWGLQNTTNWPQLGVINQQAQSWQQLFPTLMQLASKQGLQKQQWGQGLEGLGSLIMGLGGLGGGSGGGGGGGQQYATGSNPNNAYFPAGSYGETWTNGPWSAFH